MLDTDCPGSDGIPIDYPSPIMIMIDLSKFQLEFWLMKD